MSRLIHDLHSRITSASSSGDRIPPAPVPQPGATLTKLVFAKHFCNQLLPAPLFLGSLHQVVRVVSVSRVRAPTLNTVQKRAVLGR